MITDWRGARRWGTAGDFSFYWVQLANFQAARRPSRCESDWAELREAQTMTQSLPKTGQAVIIDIGDGDGHPPEEQAGRRPAAGAAGAEEATTA